MLFKADKSVLLNAFIPASYAVSVKNTIPSLECLRLSAQNGTLTVTGFDLNKGVKTELAVTVVQPGELLLNAARLTSIIRAMPDGEITIQSGDTDQATIFCGKSRFEINGFSTDGYPTLPELSGEKSFRIPKSTLKRICRQVHFSVSADETMPILTGVYFCIENGWMTAVSCDRFRMSVRREEVVCDEPLRFNIPGKTIGELIRLLDDSDEEVVAQLSPKHVIFHFDSLYFFSRLIDGEYIDYMKSATNEVKTTTAICLSHMIASCERAALVIDERAKSPVKLVIDEEKFLIRCETVNGKIEDEIPSDTKGDPITIGFNNHYLLDALRAAYLGGEDEAVIAYGGPLKGILIRPVLENNYFYFVFPVRLN